MPRYEPHNDMSAKIFKEVEEKMTQTMSGGPQHNTSVHFDLKVQIRRLEYISYQQNVQIKPNFTREST